MVTKKASPRAPMQESSQRDEDKHFFGAFTVEHSIKTLSDTTTLCKRGLKWDEASLWPIPPKLIQGQWELVNTR